jgi:uncharacterized protein (DUF433 family)
MRRSLLRFKPDIILGKRIVSGTRIPVELVIRKLGEGTRMEDLFDGYPAVTRGKVMAALIYAADLLANERIVFLKSDTGE